MPPALRPTRHFLALLAVALVIRLAVLGVGIDRELFYPDEREYVELAKNLATDNEFSYKGRPTSFRPPGFAFIMSAVFRMSGTTAPVPVRVVQIFFSLATIVVVYRLGRDGWGEQVGLIAAGVFAFYPTCIGFNNILLTEPSGLFFVSLTCWMLLRHLQNPHVGWALGAGLALGLGTLIRDTFFYGGLVTTLFLIGHKFWDRRYRWRQVASFAAGFILVLSPWIVRNTLLHGQLTMISTVGGINLYLCNSDETPLIRPGYIFITRAASGDDGYYYDSLFPEMRTASETAKQNLAMRKGLEYMIANPGITALRSLNRFVDFWGQERLVINQLLNKYYGEVPLFVMLTIILAIFVSYSFVVIAASFGYWFVRLTAFDIFGLIFIAYYTGMHTLVLGHPRYHLPLLPLLAIMAARAFLARAEIFANRRSWRFVGAISVTAVFVVIWTIGLLYFDIDKVKMLMN